MKRRAPKPPPTPAANATLAHLGYVTGVVTGLRARGEVIPAGRIALVAAITGCLMLLGTTDLAAILKEVRQKVAKFA